MNYYLQIKNRNKNNQKTWKAKANIEAYGFGGSWCNQLYLSDLFALKTYSRICSAKQ